MMSRADWRLSPGELSSAREEGMPFLERNGGVEGVVSALHSCASEGIAESEAEMEQRANVYGTNVPPTPTYSSFLDLLLEALNDPTLLVLVFAAVVSLTLGIVITDSDADSDGVEDKNTGWIEGTAILMAVVIVSLVTALNDYSKEQQFRELNRVKENRNTRVTRGGVQRTMGSFGLLVGDIVTLDTGNAVPADGILIEGYGLGVDQSAMTGESNSVFKSPDEDPFLLGGTQVREGVGKMIVTCVGSNSEWGATMALLQTKNEPTPLQEKLEVVAATIGWIGVATATLTFVVQTCHWAYNLYGAGEFAQGMPWHRCTDLVDFLIAAVTIVVVAVPEGLPLAVTIALAYSMKKMMKDNNLVRKLEACETMGGATDICSDKTGTLTENKMTVVSAWVASEAFMDVKDIRHNLSPEVILALCENISINSTAHISLEGVFCGNQTECALLNFAQQEFNYDYITSRAAADILRMQSFSSARKCMSVLVERDLTDDGEPTGQRHPRIYTKGAAEIILEKCTSVLDPSGNAVPLSDSLRRELGELVVTLCNQGLRVLCLAKRDCATSETVQLTTAQPLANLESGLSCVAIVGIKDPLRPEAAAAVAQCQKAGLVVRMVTGDNKGTADSIAREAGILTEGGLSMLGSEFRHLSDEEITRIIPSLQVLARSSPSDKYKLVAALQKAGRVVAVTGDGTNDAAALKKADVGLSMGMCGTEVAKEASDIVLMDDNFASIVKSIVWGRAVYENIRKFLQFQLTVNLVALTTAFASALMEFGTPLTAVQLLWVNLIMDSFAALALATEPPSITLLERKPYGRFEAMISKTMWRNILAQAAFQLVVQYVILCHPALFDVVPHSRLHHTISFNAFVFCQLFNEFNSRRIGSETDIFKGVFDNPLFVLIIGITFVTQVLFVQFGGSFTQCAPLSWEMWLFCIGVGALSIPFGFIYRAIPVEKASGKRKQE